MLRLNMDRTSPLFWVRRRLLSSTSMLRFQQSAEERAREEELRQKVQQRYRGMQIPESLSHEYGHFSTMGISASATQQAASNAGVDGYQSFGGTPFQNRRSVDWVILLTGCTLMYFSGKILFRQLTRGVNGLEMPLWTASVELQAKHILFAVQFQQSEQDQMKKDFEEVRQINPFVEFFEWVRSRRPEFCSGRKYGADYVMHTLVSSLSSSDGAQLATVARTLQQSMAQKNNDSLQRVDNFVEQLRSAGYLFQGIRGMGSPSVYTTDYPPRQVYTPHREVGQCGEQESDLTRALDVKNGVAHSSTPFG
ncbi:hypothetical protein LPMP_210750 [Leishmania panamensis]|uniref:Uncharacterized protein n=1 Tax=Leishmania panamensis TaxID=5679 RepID=A0A088S967_LEIPA|nr:hypothetical protein LPMP_210750 [Leishmania panamensis]AIN98156.1 hypothetical protein LPMP_210750 [Leishmania panamensis]